MDVVIINGSYHQEGMTSALIKNLKKGIRENRPKARFREIFLMDEEFGYCTGCGTCIRDSESDIPVCSVDDDVREWLEILMECDIVVLATPIYEKAPTAIMKKFLERNLVMAKGGPPKPRARPKKGKKGVVLLSAGAPWPFDWVLGMYRYSRYILRFMCKGYGCSTVRTLTAGGMESGQKWYDNGVRGAHRLGKLISR